MSLPAIGRAGNDKGSTPGLDALFVAGNAILLSGNATHGVLPSIPSVAAQKQAQAAAKKALEDDKIARASIAVVREECALKAVKTQYQVDKTRVVLLVNLANATLAKSTISDPDSKAIERLVWRQIDATKKEANQHTQAEFKLAMKSMLPAVGHAPTYKAMLVEFGVAENTLRRRLTDLYESLSDIRNLGLAPSKWLTTLQNLAQSEQRDKVLERLDALELPKAGRQPYLSGQEVDCVAAVMSQLDQTGSGLTRRGARAKLMDIVHSKGHHLLTNPDATAAETKQATSMTNAKITPKFLRQNFGPDSLQHMQVDGQARPTFRKTSNISLKRAAAANPLLQEIMLRKYRQFCKTLFDEGKIASEEPGPGNVWNFDETGFGGDTGSLARFTIGAAKDERRFALVSSEHNLLWVTAAFAVSATGKLGPQILIHKGGSDSSFPANFAMNLAATQNWLLEATSSGYMSKRIFRVWATKFVECCAPTPGNGHILFIDGHDSHFEPTALKYLYDQGIFVFFLKANDSINDQPLDMGPNSVLKSCYKEEYEVWRATNPTVQITPAFFNHIMSAAWGRFQSNPELPRIIISAFAKAGLCPITPLADSSAEASVLLKSANRIAEVFATDEKDVAEAKRRRLEAISVPDGDLSVRVTNQTVLAAVEVSRKNMDPTVYRLAISAGVADALTRSHIIPAQEVTAAIQRQKQLSKVQIPHDNKALSTTTGLGVTSDIIERMQQAEQERNEKQAAKLQAQQRTQARRSEQAKQQEAAKQELVKAAADGNAWESQKLDWLKLACKGLGGTGNGKKAEIIVEIKAKLQQQHHHHQQPPLDPAHIQPYAAAVAFPPASYYQLNGGGGPETSDSEDEDNPYH